MPNNPINKVVYGNDVLMDLTEDTVEPASLVLGTTAHDRSGAAITGTFDPSIYVEKAGDTMTGRLHITGVAAQLDLDGGDSESGPITYVTVGEVNTGAYASGTPVWSSTLNMSSIHVNDGGAYNRPSVANSKRGVELNYEGAVKIVYREGSTYKEINLPADLALSSGTATRNNTNATAGTCNWYQAGRVVTVTVTGVALTADAANNSDIFTGLPEAKEQTNCIAMGNTSGCTRWYVTTGGALRVGAMALRNQTIYLNFSYISAS